MKDMLLSKQKQEKITWTREKKFNSMNTFSSKVIILYIYIYIYKATCIILSNFIIFKK
jgi:hypothetical protein